MTSRSARWGRQFERFAPALAAVIALSCILSSTDLDAPPRYDGAGYAVLATSILEGNGYRAIDQPDAPQHAHFPPGYPAALAASWTWFGRSDRVAHVLSAACTTIAVWFLAHWFARVESPRVAAPLALALAFNWSWARVGGSIQSEPLFLLLTALAVNAADRLARTDRRNRLGTLGLGVLLAACVLTRHVGACLVLAVVVDLAWRERRAAAIAVGATATLLISPWIAWQLRVGRGSQAGLLTAVDLPSLVASQALFYARRIPDHLAGPFVEVATVFGRSPGLAASATAGAIGATALVLYGLVKAALNPRRRLAGLIPLATLALLLAWPFTEAGRFLVPLVPFLLVGAVEGLSRVGPMGRARAAWLLLAAAVPYTAYSALPSRVQARERTHADFDDACRWLAARGKRPDALVLTRHPGEVFWQTRLRALVPPDDPAAIARLTEEGRQTFLMVDDDRFANAPASPIGRYVEAAGGRVRTVYDRGVIIYEVTSSAPRR
ncbi:glycosyltransferase family 39 protein [Isosphaeraceae bacterium EP7]